MKNGKIGQEFGALSLTLTISSKTVDRMPYFVDKSGICIIRITLESGNDRLKWIVRQLFGVFFCMCVLS